MIFGFERAKKSDMKCLSCCCSCFSRTKKKSQHVEEELTKENPIKNNTIEELKLKLGNKETDSDTTASMIPETQKGSPHHPSSPHINEDGLIIPRKPHNPILENAERQSLHKELLFNQKIGKNVLNQKSELQKALEKHKDNIAKKEYENHLTSRAPELEKVIADRAKRRQESTPVDQTEDDKGLSKEFLEARAKLKARTESK